MKRMLVSLFVLASLIIASGVVVQIASGQQGITPKPTPPPGEDIDERLQIEAAVKEALGVNPENVPAILMYEEVIENVRISADGEWALVFLAFADPETGEIAATEPGLAFAHKQAGAWNAILPSNANWPEALQNLPEGLISPEERQDWWQMYSTAQAEVAAVGTLTGYYLPWNGGESMRLTGSTAHDSYITSGSSHYAFDFANGTMFPIHAAKPGTVHSVRVECKNGDENCSNWIILEDTSTSPTTYQLYLHLAHESVPLEIRAKGTRIHQGQFLGLADDTGASTGHHLHFHVHSNPNTWWAPSLDITFVDVPINGGRPRIDKDLKYCTRSTDVCRQVQTFYVSGNVFHGDAIPPQGGITAPQPGAVLNSGTVTLQGWASDVGMGVLSSQFMAYYKDQWHDVGKPITTTTSLSLNWDMCQAGVPDGPLALAVRVLDKDGNQAPGFPGLRQVVNNAGCPPPPPCTPNADQVALFADRDHSGACVILNKGSYSSGSALGAVGDNNLESIRVGTNVRAKLYSDASYKGRLETLSSSDLSLADNPIGLNTVSSVVVETDTGLTGVADSPVETSSSDEPNEVEAVTAVSAPWSDDMQKGYNGWTTPGTTNLWDQAMTDAQNIAWYYGQDGRPDYNTGAANAGNLDTPSITIPADGKTYYLRFRYKYQTEGPGVHWDWRKLQISVNGGSFTDLYQFSEDPMGTWLNSPAFSLKDYAGKSIQLRFRFDTRDSRNNSFEGWYIDDISITAEPPPNCADNNQSPAQAVTITHGAALNGVICPAGDVDFYKFQGTAGERIGAVVDALTANSASKLDATLVLLDGDGKQILAENDDQVPGERSDPWLTYVLKRSGEYYLKVIAWDHPSAGSETHTYTLRFFKEKDDPERATFRSPTYASFLQEGSSFPVSLEASDSGSGISHMVFYRHSGDWKNGKWELADEDWDGSDGWGFNLATDAIPCGTHIALYAEVYDWAGNSIGVVVGDLNNPCNQVFLPNLRR